MKSNLNIACNLCLVIILCALVSYGIGWVSDVTTEHQKDINISTKYHIPYNDITNFPMRGKNIILDGNNIVYLISKDDYEKCIIGEKITIVYRTFYLPFMKNITINKIVIVTI